MKFTGIEKRMLIVAIIFIFGLCISIPYCTKKSNQIKKEGLQSVFNELWYGEKGGK